ncbi:prenyltransferase/squalene oxidase repeat-containing protein [Aureliella helgolandensis]|uniref:prenyltransferase/squalene oxidase repeat-containing protein n=1 Tax=Aureliella helgolandensis TaxID=2527968 RepID=UPI0011A052FF|nr:prenyltransferase/squalene oxidase repeat-containing protein [Aureliella helgolandensis]
MLAPKVQLQRSGRAGVAGKHLVSEVRIQRQHEAAEKTAQLRRTPSWLFSFVFHLVLLLILAVIPIADLTRGPLTLFFGQPSSSGDGEFELLGIESSLETELENTESQNLESLSNTSPLQQVNLPKMLDLPAVEPLLSPSTSVSIPIGIQDGLTGRTGALKQALLDRFGGSAETEQAVEMGLAWLVQQQNSNGSWSLVGPYSRGGANENITAATAMAVNAFLGAGHTPIAGKYQQEVKLAINFLVQRQDKDGFFADREPSRQQMYAQAIASISIIEAYGMTGDSKLKMAALKAVKYAEWSKSDLHGWRYEPREDADLSVTGWYVMALETARMAGLGVDEKQLAKTSKFLDQVSSKELSQYAYTDFQPPSLSMTAEGLLCRIFLGWPQSHPALIAGIQDVLLPAAPSLDSQEQSVYFWYYATQVMHHFGGPAWDKWNTAMKKVLPALQEKEGDERGSWSSQRDSYGAAGGRLYTTCLNLYCLEVYYRHLAIYHTD